MIRCPYRSRRAGAVGDSARPPCGRVYPEVSGMNSDVEAWALFPVLLFVGCVLAAGLLVSGLLATAARGSRQAEAAAPRTCRPCALSHPPFAHYCRRCGRKL